MDSSSESESSSYMDSCPEIESFSESDSLTSGITTLLSALLILAISKELEAKLLNFEVSFD